MKKDADRVLRIGLFLDAAFLPLCTSFVQKAATALGLGEEESMALTLATEEIFAYLCRIASPDQPLEIRCSSGRYYVQAEFTCPFEDFDMRFFNLTASVSPDDERSLEEMGLLIASRFVDRLDVRRAPNQGILLSLVKEKDYPAVTEIGTGIGPEMKPEVQAPAPETSAEFSIEGADPENMKLFAQRVNARFPAWLFPQSFRFPGKVVDMVAGGEYEAALAFGPGKRLQGGIVWHWASGKTVECYGPYLFGRGSVHAMADALTEACIGAVAKTPAVGLVNPFPTPDLPREHFEVLGDLTLVDEKGAGIPLTSHFRLMQEDPGTTSWCHPDLEMFLRQEYARLVLPRQIHSVKDMGEVKNAFSVLAAEFDRPQNKVVLRPIRPGRDAPENLENHLKLFRREALQNVFFMMDLGFPWQCDFTSGLLRSGFTPRVVIPYGGKGDMILFQLGTELP